MKLARHDQALLDRGKLDRGKFNNRVATAKSLGVSHTRVTQVLRRIRKRL